MTTTSPAAKETPQRPPADNGRRRWQWVAAASAAAFIVLMTLTLLPAPRTPFYQGLDVWWHSITAGPAGGEVTGLVAFLNAFGGPASLIVMLVVLIVLAIMRRWWAMLFTFLTYLVPSIFAQLLKNIVDRPRPGDALVMVDHGSFPSGHVVTTVAFVIMIAVLLPAAARRIWWPIGIAFVLVMMWSRTYLSAHWVTDTLAGAVVGAGVTLMLWWLFAPLLARDDARRARRKQKRAELRSGAASY